MGDGKVAVAYIHPGEITGSFHLSIVNLILHDITESNRIIPGGTPLVQEVGSGRLVEGRNQAARQFLDSTCEWLFWVDADMGFQPDTLDRLLAAADPDERPVVGALCFGHQSCEQREAQVLDHDIFPTLYRATEIDGQPGFVKLYDYPRDALLRVDGTGSACILIHRRVVEAMRDRFNADHAFGEPYDQLTIPKGPTTFSEDLSFCLRCSLIDVPIHVHTGIRTSHKKVHYLDEHAYEAQRTKPAPTYVIVPVKDRLALTESILAQLAEQGGYDEILVVDNGSGRKARNWLDTQTIATVIDMPDVGIHTMWNRALQEVRFKARRANVAILNNDLKLGPQMLARLAHTLRANPDLAVVSPNYDGRVLHGVEYRTDICAGRYDGTGGIAGFAFMLRSEWDYWFPEDLRWWYGDNDMLRTAHAQGWRTAIVGDATVEHLDGGSQTGDWDAPEMRVILDADRATHLAKWS